MRITNRMSLPQSLVNACEVEPHNADGCLSATTLLKGAKQVLLERRHWDELEDDVSDRLWAVFGTAVHRLLEEKNPGSFTEETFSVRVGSKTVTGTVDLYDMERGEIVDYKTASAWKVVFSNFDDWRRQGLAYAWLLRESGLEVKRCRFVAMLRDWSKTEASRNPDYPQSQVFVYEFDVTDDGLTEIEEFVRNKVAKIEKAEPLPDDDIEPCTPEERWDKESTYAVMREGRKSAVRVFNDRDTAENMAKSDPKLSVVERKGCSVRCEGYCLCNRFCDYYKRIANRGDAK